MSPNGNGQDRAYEYAWLPINVPRSSRGIMGDLKFLILWSM